MRPRRSVLFMPGANSRAMDKARTLACDTIIFDLEDAVATDVKDGARAQVAQQIDAGGYGHRELVVRCNGLDTDWVRDDVAALAARPIDGLLFPKVETSDQVRQLRACIDEFAPAKPLWIMIETPLGVRNVEDLAALDVEALVMGTSDLVKALRGRHTDDRTSVMYALSRCILAARLAGKDILDGVHLDFRNLDAFEHICNQGRDLGFDGKTLIHPSQVEIANRVFGVDPDDLARAREVIQAWREAREAGKGVAVVDGQLIESLHVEESQRLIEFAEALDQRT